MSAPPSLSILVPVYNYGVEPLVRALSAQCVALSLDHEIRVYDDGSAPLWASANQGVQELPGVTYQVLGQNIGRSRIRNLMAKEARKDLLLFLDCDSGIPTADFIAAYMAQADAAVVVGGTLYAPGPPVDAQHRLHWKVGKAREERKASQRATSPYRSITLNNILVAKAAFLHVLLDESIRTYGHEDTKFGQQLKEQGITIRHIDNPVVHNGLSTNTEFLAKTREAQRNLYRLYATGCYGTGTGVVRTYRQLARLGMTSVFTAGYRLMQPLVERMLLAGTAPLFFFDVYKLYHFIRNEQAPA